MTSVNATVAPKRRAAALRRRATYDARVAAATTARRKNHSLVWWWLAELARLGETRRAEEYGRLERITATLNEGGIPDDCP